MGVTRQTYRLDSLGRVGCQVVRIDRQYELHVYPRSIVCPLYIIQCIHCKTKLTVLM